MYVYVYVRSREGIALNNRTTQHSKQGSMMTNATPKELGSAFKLN